jgi:PAS domain S-box-containing protein
VTCAPGIDDTFVDRGMWEKIVFNLLSNAFKHTFEGEIRVAVEADAARATLTVADTGTGIDAAELPHIFERFRRVENARARTHEGTGIGLALVAELVKLHGGTIEVQSEPGKGTRFRVSLPRGSAHLPQDRIRRARAALPTLGAAPYVEEAHRWMGELLDDDGADDIPSPALVGARVLVADDNADMRDYIRRLLRPHWSVQTVTDGAAALAAALADPPDLVLTDAMMPGLDGFALLAALRADPRTRTIPVIILSARAGEESRVEGFDAGADDYLVKPFAARELVARVNTHLQLAAARRRFAQDLERERATLETVLRQMPAGVVIAEADTEGYLFVNDEARRILGAADAGDGVDIFPDERVLHPDGRPYRREERPMVRSIRHGEVVNDHQFRFIRGDGRVVALSVSSAPVRDRDGRITGAVVTFQDVTEWRALVTREQVARAEADAANRAKDNFLAVLSHELRTPLNAILGWTRILKSTRAADEDKARAAEVIERNTLRQSQLVNDLLDVSRIAAGKVELDRFPVDLASVVGDAVDAVRADVEAKQLALVLDLDPLTGEVLADVLRLQQVVLNVLTNSIKFTPTGGRIDVRLARQGEMARLTVTDTGEGIDPAVLPYVFEPFRQGAGTDTTRAHEGLGLGLTIVRQFVALHGGTVRAESAGRGKGTTMTLELPITAVRVPRPRRRADSRSDSRPVSGPARLDGTRVLVVDDQPDARELLTLVMRQHGAEPHAAASVADALAILGETPIDILVSDLALPGVDGYDLIAAVRANPDWQHIGAIALTAYMGHAVRERAAEAGFDAHATKPLDADDLVALIATLPQRRPR